MTTPDPTAPARPVGEALDPAAIRKRIVAVMPENMPLRGRMASAIMCEVVAPLLADAAETAALRQRVADLERDVRAAVIEVGEQACARGEAEGKLRVSEMAGIVEGWRDRALAAEARTTADQAAVQSLRDALCGQIAAHALLCKAAGLDHQAHLDGTARANMVLARTARSALSTTTTGGADVGR